jgi:hypothetical protein
MASKRKAMADANSSAGHSSPKRLHVSSGSERRQTNINFSGQQSILMEDSESSGDDERGALGVSKKAALAYLRGVR